MKIHKITFKNYRCFLNDEINFIDEEPMLNYPLMKLKEAEGENADNG